MTLKSPLKDILGIGSIKSTGTTLDSLLKSNENAKAKLEAAGIDDPTAKTDPSALERIFGITDALGTGVRGLVYNAVSASNVNVWDEMGKALKGESRVEGADILEELGSDNEWVNMIGGLAVDVLLDPLTYLTLGYGAAAKASGKAALTALSKGDDIYKAAKAAGIADDAVPALKAALEAKGLMTGGKLADVTKLSKEASQELMTTLYGQFGKGGVKVAGVSLGGADKVSKAGYKAKELARKVPGSKWIEQTFGMGSVPGEAVDLFREGNEATNTLVKALRKDVGYKIKANDAVAARFEKELTEIIPDESARKWASVAIGRQFGEERFKLADLVDNVREAMGGGDQGAIDSAIATMTSFRNDLLARAQRNISDTLKKTAGLSDDQVLQAVEGIKRYESQLEGLYQGQKSKGLLGMGVFGDDAKGFLPGVATEKVDDGTKSVLDTLGIDSSTLGAQKHPQASFLDRYGLTPAETQRKTFLTPEDRALGMARDADGAVLNLDAAATGGLKTEFDLAKLGGAAQKSQGRRIALKEFQDDLTAALGNDKLAKSMADQVQDFFTKDASTEGFLGLFDKVQNLWKRQATIMRFPAFQSRNGLSNKLLMYQDGALSVGGEAKSLKLITNMQRKSLSPFEQEELAKELDELYRAGVMTSFEEITEQTGRGSTGNKATQLLGKINAIIENQSRISAYYTFRAKGLSPAAAGEMVNKALLDYSDDALSVFERHVVKRLVPFYKWIKGNTSKQMRVLIESPGKSVWLGHLKESGEAVTEYDESIMPKWMRDTFPVPLPISDNGDPIMLSTAGLFPQGDLEILSGLLSGKFDPKDAFGSLSPILRTPLELLFNKDLWYDTDIESYEGEMKRAPGYIEAFGDLVSGVEGLGDVWRFICDTLNIQEREDEGEAYYYMAGKSVKVMRDMVPWMNAVGKLFANQRKTPYDQAAFGTGVKTMLYDTESFTKNKAYADREALNDAVKKMQDESTATTGTMTLEQLLGVK